MYENLMEKSCWYSNFKKYPLGPKGSFVTQNFQHEFIQKQLKISKNAMKPEGDSLYSQVTRRDLWQGRTSSPEGKIQSVRRTEVKYFFKQIYY